jgi:periplasmic copper chaperone A
MIRWAASFAFVVLLASCSGGASSSAPSLTPGSVASQIDVFAATVTPDGDSADASFAVHNGSGVQDRLIGVSCACATAAEIHGADATGDLGPVDSVALPPEKVVTFSPGGPHVVLAGLTQPLTPGGTVTLELRFARSPSVQIVADVEALAAPSPA